LDLFANPVGYRTSLDNNALPTTLARILLFFIGSCSKTEVSEQLYYKFWQVDGHDFDGYTFRKGDGYDVKKRCSG
jgi:hypothetical protein